MKKKTTKKKETELRTLLLKDSRERERERKREKARAALITQQVEEMIHMRSMSHIMRSVSHIMRSVSHRHSMGHGSTSLN